jgi:hypothetical protein
MNDTPHTISQHGFTFAPQVLDQRQREEILALIGPVPGAGRRGLLALPLVRELATSDTILNLVRPHLPSEPTPVRAIYFDKSPDANWLVPWHQDLTIALSKESHVPGFVPWSVKDGIPHVQPPVECLEQMLAVRLHFDDTDANNGALKVLPGTHSMGRLSAERIQELRGECEDFLCRVSAGDALVMRPLLLHASSRSTSDRHRRVMHIEYAGFALPSELDWHNAA